MKNESNPIKDHRKEQRLFSNRIWAASILVALLVMTLFARLAYLQIGEHKLYTTMAKANQLNVIPIPPNRGLIYDRNGVLIAENIPVFSLDITPDQVKNLPNTIAALQNIMPIDQEDVDQFYRELRQKRPYDDITLRVKLSPDEVAAFSLDQYQFPGVQINAHLIRSYPLNSAVVSVLGYVGRINENELKRVDPTNYLGTDFIGKIGVEKYFEDTLHGTVGYQQVEMDASGQVVRVLKEIPPIPGNNLYLTIDTRLQQAAETALGDRRGAVVVIQPATGQVLALVSQPAYDPNLFVTGISSKDFNALRNSPDQPLYNRAIRGQYPPGSTIKPLEALQGLATNTVTPTYQIFDPGWFSLPNNTHRYRDWRRGGHGWVDVSTAVTQSCDVYFYNLAVKMGIKNVDAVFSAFGLGQETGIQMGEELPGIVPNPTWKMKTKKQPWYTGDTVITAIGQGFMLATPLQLANAAAILAERGQHFQPNLILKQQLPNGQFVDQAPIPLPSVNFPADDWDIVINAMLAVTDSPRGTAYSAFRGNKLGYDVAGKTGTAQVYSVSQKDDPSKTAGLPERLRDHSWFIAFAPVEQPQVAIAVIVENSPHAATLVARQVLDTYFTEHPLPTATIVPAANIPAQPIPYVPGDNDE